MTANLYLAVMVTVCIITPIVSLVYHSVKSYKDLVKNIRAAEIAIIDQLKERSPGDTLDWVVDVVMAELESALRAK